MATSNLVLASASPRRNDLLLRYGFEFTVVPADIDERFGASEAPHEAVVRLAMEKALAVRDRVADADILAADTCVVCEDTVLAKPADFDDALRMLSLLSGRNHRVITAWVVLCATRPHRSSTGVAISVVRMREIPRREAIAYASTAEPYDKAGAYAAQGEGQRFIAGVIGPFDNVVGLPMVPVKSALARIGHLPR